MYTPDESGVAEVIDVPQFFSPQVTRREVYTTLVGGLDYSDSFSILIYTYLPVGGGGAAILSISISCFLYFAFNFPQTQCGRRLPLSPPPIEEGGDPPPKNT